MVVRDIPVKIEGWEFQDLLRQLADNSKPGFAIPQLKYDSKQAIKAPQRKHMFGPNRNVRVPSLVA